MLKILSSVINSEKPEVVKPSRTLGGSLAWKPFHVSIPYLYGADSSLHGFPWVTKGIFQ